jgi:hypothetical protein
VPSSADPFWDRHVGTSGDKETTRQGYRCAGTNNGEDEFPIDKFMNLLANEVDEYITELGKRKYSKRGADENKGGHACRCCPARKFQSPQRLKLHVIKYHIETAKYAPAGAKHFACAKAIFENDCMRGEKGNNYLSRAATTMRSHVGKGIRSNKTNFLDKEASLILDLNGPRFVLKRALDRMNCRRVGDSYYTQSFARNLMLQALTCEGYFERARMKVLSQAEFAGSEVVALAPRRWDIWENLLEDIFMSPGARKHLDKMLAKCEQAKEYESISVDGQSKSCLPLSGQVSSRAPKYLRCAQALPEEESLHTVLTFRGKTGAVLAISAKPRESAEGVRSAMLENMYRTQLEQVRHVCSDCAGP